MTNNWHSIIQHAQQLRHELHRHPELSWKEEKTARLIRRELELLDIPWRACAGTGTVATLNAPGQNTKHTALRGDIDALPISEKTEKSYRSESPGCMHACGHDGHTATLLGAARWLKLHESSLLGKVSLLFQPAEEGGHGAKFMIQDGALDGVDEIFGWHNWPAIPFAQLACPDDIVMCGNGTFTITVTGIGGHASQPELCRDPVLAASAIVMGLQQIVARRISPQNSAVVSVTSIDALSAATVIAETAILSGSIRVPNEALRQQLNALLVEVSCNIGSAYGVDCEVDIQNRYQATINHPIPAARVREIWQRQWGLEAIASATPLPIMASEDFSYYLSEIPGAFALIGADDGDKHHQKPCHNAHYDFNDRLIPRVCGLFAELVQAPLPKELNATSF
ncbi:MAG: amidohydrolase [Lentisphaeria bacterium]|jgi:amidohydrolase